MLGQNVCSICGANYEYAGGRWKCPACGAYKAEELSGEEVTLLYNAAQKLRLLDFDEAEKAYSDIIERYPNNPEGYWGRLLSRHGIKYEENFDGKKIPTCYAGIDSITSDRDYAMALSLADGDTKVYYEKQAEYMEGVRKEWVEKAKREKPYDIFISYKDGDLENGIERTEDSIAAQELYIHLTRKGYRVFFSRESLRDKVGEKYEPYIFGALSTAKVMLVYGSKPEYIASTWIKNEWTRYAKRIQSGEKKSNSLIVACDGFSPSELPKALSSRQCMDAGSKNFYTDLDAIIASIIKEKENTAKKSEKKKSKKLPIAIASCAALAVLFLSVILYLSKNPAGKNDNISSITDSKYGVVISAGDKSFDKNTSVLVEKLLSGAQYNSLVSTVGTVKSLEIDNAVIYDIECDAEISEKVTVKVAYSKSNSESTVKVYYVSEDKSVIEEHNCSYGGGFVEFETVHFSYYVICEVMEKAAPVVDDAVLRFISNGGDGSMEYVAVKTNATVTLPQNAFIRAGYNFAGWSTSDSGSVEYEDGAEYKTGTGTEYTLYAVWTVIDYPITYVLNGGINSPDNPEKYNVNSDTVILADPERAGYTFSGWYSSDVLKSDTIVKGSTGEKTFVASWSANQNLLIFNANGGDGSMSSIKYSTDTVLTLPHNAFSRAGYTFAGWSTSESGSVKYEDESQYTVGASPECVLYAVWLANTNSLILKANDGTSNEKTVNMKTDEAKPFPSNTFVREGYTFVGWSSTSGGTAEYADKELYTMGASSVTFYAVWSANANKVIFNANGGDGEMEAQIIKTDGVASLARCAFVRLGYRFLGWAIAADGNSVYVDGATYKMGASSEYTLHAVWEELEQGLEYSLSADGTYTVSGYSGSLTRVEIPALHNRIKVTRIGDRAFENSTVTGIAISEYVKTIGIQAFKGCESLTEVYFCNELWWFVSEDSSATAGITVDVSDETENATYLKSTYCNYHWIRDVKAPHIHTPADEKIENKVDATCTQDGSYDLVVRCDSCSEILSTKKVKLSAEGHKYVSGICSGCGKLSNNLSSSYSRGLVFVSNGDKTCYLAGIGTCTDTVVVIPAISPAGDVVTGLSVDAFNGYKNITAVIIPDSVTYIEEYAFCSLPVKSIKVDEDNLFYKDIDGNLYTKDGKSFIQYAVGKDESDFVIPNGVTSIAIEAFTGSKLKSLLIPASVNYIDVWAFCGKSLTKVTFEGSPIWYVSEWGEPENSEYIDVSDASKNATYLQTTYAEHYWSRCDYSQGLEFVSNGDKTCYVKGLGACTDRALIIPPKSPEGDTVTSIASYAFYGCDSIVSVMIGHGITSIGDYAFDGCDSLMSVTIIGNVKTVGNYAFNSCDNLGSVTIGDSVESIGRDAFSGCYSLSGVQISDLRAWCDIHFTGYYANPLYLANNLYVNAVLLSELIIPDGVDVIGMYAFYNADCLESLVIPDSVTFIDVSAFYSCDKLKTVTIGAGVTEIGESAFYDCDNLTSVTFKDTVGWWSYYLGYIEEGYCIDVSNTAKNAARLKSDPNVLCNDYYDSSMHTNKKPAVRENVKEATCTQEGSYDSVVYCSVCGVVVSRKNMTIPKTEHKYVNGSCTECGKADGLEYELSADATYYIVSGIGESKDTEIVIPSTYRGLPVKEIGKYAFDYESITRVKIPDSVIIISHFAFYDCDGLTEIIIPDGVESIGISSFYDCDGLTNVIIPNSVESIGSSAFARCDRLANVVIGDGVESIVDSAFVGCSSLAEISVDESNRYYKDIDGNLYSKDGKILIQYAIGKTETSFTVPYSVRIIKSEAFLGCIGLKYNSYDGAKYLGSADNPYFALIKAVNFENSCEINPQTKIITDGAFSGCGDLVTVEIPNGVEAIGNTAFAHCYTLKSIVFPSSVTSVGGEAFSGCASLNDVYISDMTAWCNVSFLGNCSNPLSNGANLYLNGELVTELVIPNGIKSIGNFAFDGCESIKSVVIPNGVTSIGDSAFSFCRYLTEVEMSDSVASIGASAFSNSSVDGSIIGNGVISIGASVFAEVCIENLIIPNSVKCIASTAFSFCDVTNIIVGENNQHYKAIDGNLYSKDGKALILYAAGKEATSFIVPEGVEAIADYAFYTARNLVSIVIPKSVTSIGASAFASTGITSIKYRGSKSEWDTISKGARWGDEAAYTIVYGYEEN